MERKEKVGSMIDKISLLEKDYWSNQDIMKFFDLTESIAKRIKKEIVEERNIGFVPRKISKQWVFDILLVDYYETLKLLKILEQYKKNEEDINDESH